MQYKDHTYNSIVDILNLFNDKPYRFVNSYTGPEFDDIGITQLTTQNGIGFAFTNQPNNMVMVNATRADYLFGYDVFTYHRFVDNPFSRSVVCSTSKMNEFINEIPNKERVMNMNLFKLHSTSICEILDSIQKPISIHITF